VVIIALYLDEKVAVMSIIADYRHVELVNASISSLQLDFCTLTDVLNVFLGGSSHHCPEA